MEYVYGIYLYANCNTAEFRYPSEKEYRLCELFANVTVEVWIDGEWKKRRGIVVQHYGNFFVSPA